MMPQLTATVLFALANLARPVPTAQPAAAAPGGNVPTLKQVMADPSWFARSPESASWLPGSNAVVWDQRREGVLGRHTYDRFIQTLDHLQPDKPPVMLDDASYSTTLPASGDWSPDRSRMVASHGGDLFLWTDDAGWTQLTRTVGSEWGAMFLADADRIAFRRDGRWVVRSGDGAERDAADVRFAEDPAEKEPKERDDLAEREHELFAFLRENEARDTLNEGVNRRRAGADTTNPPGPFYLDPKQRDAGRWLSPSGDWLLVAMTDRDSAHEPADQMPAYVTETGYVTTSRVRPKVGEEVEQAVAFVLLDLAGERVIGLPLDGLPGITDDPLAAIRAAAADRQGDNPRDTDGKEQAADDTESQPAQPVPDDGPDTDPDAEPDGEQAEPDAKPRPVSEWSVRWSDSGRHAAVMLGSHDNKDRWIVTVDTLAEPAVWTTAHHERDAAWIGSFNGFGFVPGTETLWFTSEQSGWGHLYVAQPGETPKALTEGPWEVRSVTAMSDGESFLARTNRGDRGVWEVERITMDGTVTPVTAMGGMVESFELSPDETRVLFTCSGLMDPPELFLTPIRGGEPARITDTDTDLYRSFDWVKPELVWVPSTHTEGAVHMRVYRPDPARYPGPRPIVVFAHGAGYLQFADRGWTENYYREHMFHTLLADRGILVIGPDFRHSAGYGRDWRAAVYRDMGEPELQDLDDCLAYAAAELGGDPEKVGIYGGSYGGFLTLMAMFLRPDTYDCGAALRSVADWRHYNHGWTSNVLDTPAVDPEPFDRCSPITHAEGLQGALLMCHGMLDNNVVAQGVVRLSQRLIELEKDDWELALYPAEAHGFEEPSGWLDEYRRILELFEENLLGPG